MLTDTPAPASGQAEQAVLGAILNDCSILKEAKLRTSDFFFEENKEIWRAIVALSRKGVPPDPITVSDFLERNANGNAGNAWSHLLYVEQISSLAAAQLSFASHLAMVKQLAAQRRAREVAFSIMQRIDNGNLPSIEEITASFKTAIGEQDDNKTFNLTPIGLDMLTIDPPARQWLLKLNNEGFLPRGKVGILTAEGGTGKTASLIQLAISVATDANWLGLINVEQGGSVIMLLGEEDHEETHRRVRRVARSMKLSPEQEELAAGCVVIKSLAGHSMPLTEDDGAPTPHLEALRNSIPPDCALIVIDPLSRFAGGEVEGGNNYATRFIQSMEYLAQAPSGPTVLLATHSSKLARRAGSADVRGVTGLTDAARWVASMTRKSEYVSFEVVKTNYTLPSKPLTLHWNDGVLNAATPQDEKDSRNSELNKNIDRIIDVISQHGPQTSKRAIASLAGIRYSAAIAALDTAINRGLIQETGSQRARKYLKAFPTQPERFEKSWTDRD